MARFVYECPLRWSDLDAFGHVNNVKFLTLLEEARVALFFTAAKETGLTSFAEGCVIARHEIDYLRPLDHRPQVRIETWVSEVKNSSFTVCYEVYADAEMVCAAKSVGVLFDLSTQRPRRVNDAEREYMESWMDSQAGT